MTDPSAFPHTREIDVDQLMESTPGPRFRANASLEEGVSGRLGIDTLYENTAVDETLDLVSSDKTRYEDNPAAHDLSVHRFPWRDA